MGMFVIQKTIDDLGRVQIPKHIREKYGIKPGDSVILTGIEDDTAFKIVIRKESNNELINRI